MIELLGYPGRSRDDLDALASKDRVERAGELCVPSTGLVVLTQIRQDDGQVVGRAQGVGVVVAQHPA
jgi:hypothetical protein